jgi:outer membrane protein OmpA-like peptidoglycan-associated protein
MKTGLSILLAGLAGAAGPMVGGPVLAADDHLLQAVPTAEDFIKVLTPTPIAKTRGIKPLAEVAAETAYADVPMITFEFGSAELTTGARQVLDQLAAALQSQQLSSSRFLLEGYTDAVGSDAYNQALSERRARAARDYLATRQIGAARLDAVGKGESEPLEQTDGPSEINRRVRVVNLGE